MKGIVFTPIMNVARRDGTKSMTRRIKSLGGKPPYKVGEVLYVRERHRMLHFDKAEILALIEYGDGSQRWVDVNPADIQKIAARKKPFAWLPGRYMLASFARDHIRVTAIRSEQLRAITEADARAEGVEQVGQWYRNYLGTSAFASSAVQSFQSLWQSIHGPESWSANPEVWVIEFENCEKPTANDPEEKECKGNCGASYCDEYGCLDKKPKADPNEQIYVS